MSAHPWSLYLEGEKCMPDDKTFIYKDARGYITARMVTNISETERYIQGICLKAEALRTFRKDRILEYVDDPQIINEKLEYHLANNPNPISFPNSHHGNIHGSPEICFTGFKKADKDELIKIAESAGMFIRSSVTKKLEFLCCGYNAGPKKIEKSRHQGVVVLSESQLKTMLETGEIPEEA